MSVISVAAVQMQSGDDKAANVARALELIERAAEGGARIVALPEFFAWWGPARRQIEQAEPVPGPTIEAIRRRAADRRIYVLAGSIAEIGPGGKVFNTSVFIGPSGEMLGAYRKMHLFDVDIAGRLRMKESDGVQAGDAPVVVDTEFGKVGLTVCYDLRFPELYRRLADAGAQTVMVPSSFMAATGKDHWEPLLRARAIENQAFMVAPNEIGPIPGSRILRYGRSMIVDPWGTVLAQADDAEGVILAGLDFAYLEKVRRELPVLAHRRRELTAGPPPASSPGLPC